MGGKWLSGRRRQTVTLLGNLALVRIQPFSFIMRIKLTFKNFLKNKNKFTNLEKSMLIKSPNSVYEYLPVISTAYFNSFWLSHYNLLTIKKIKSINIYIIKLFYEIIFFQSLSTNKQPYIGIHTLDLNFAKRRFFPQLKNMSMSSNNQQTLFNNSLGITSKYFSKSKKFLRSKASYIFSASYVRRFLMYLGINDLCLLIRKLPMYLKDIIRVILSPTNVLYKNPFLDEIVNEKKLRIKFSFAYVYFFNNKPYGL